MQTLHPERFDQGTIVAQTPYPGFKHGCSTVPELLALTSAKGAEMLVQAINSRLYLQSARSPSIIPDDRITRAARAAPKITSQDRFIDWHTWTAEIIIRRHLAVGPLWNFAKHAQKVRRLIWTTGFTILEDVAISPELSVGQLVIIGNEGGVDGQVAYVRTCDDRVLQVDSMKIEGGVESTPLRAAKKADMIDLGTCRQNESMTRILLSADSRDGH